MERHKIPIAPKIDSYESFLRFNEVQKNKKSCTPIIIREVDYKADIIDIVPGDSNIEKFRINVTLGKVILSFFLFEFVTKGEYYISYNIELLHDYDYNKIYSKTHPKEYKDELYAYARNLLTIGETRFNLSNFDVLITSDSSGEIGLKVLGYDWNAWSSTNESPLVIPYGITSIGHGAFNNNGIFETVEFPSTVKVIGEYAFSNTDIHNLIIPGSVEEIEEGAFADCRSLSNVTLLEGLKTIGEFVFYHTTLTEVAIPDTVEKIGEMAFKSCDDLKHIKLPKGLKLIDSQVFSDASIEELIIPNGVEEIGDSCFCGCNLKKLVLPKTLKRIGPSAFEYTDIEEVYIPDAVEEMGDRAFALCTDLRKVHLPKNLKTYISTIFVGTHLDETINRLYYNSKSKGDINKLRGLDVEVQL